MPTAIDASIDAAASLEPLQKIFGASLYGAAQQLVDARAVLEVRVLQNGRVVTGIAGTGTGQNVTHRVYIQRGLDDKEFEGECSCGERNPCVHAAAVMIAFAKRGGGWSTDNPRGALDSNPLPQRTDSIGGQGIPTRQRLHYLLEASGVEVAAAGGALRLSAWVTQNLDGGGIQPDVQLYVARAADGSRDYPRYVDAYDRAILEFSSARPVAGLWTSSGAVGFELLRRTVATGRTFWRSLQSRALRSGPSQQVVFEWRALPNGDQRLHCKTSEVFALLLGLEPAAYIDTASGDCGVLELPYSKELLRYYWNCPAIAPEDVSTCNEHIARDPDAGSFPRLSAMALQVQTLSRLHAKLVLSAEPAATLHYVYNGMSVDSRSLGAAENTVRYLDGDLVCEVARDPETERRLRAQLDQVLVPGPWDGKSWLAFMMNAVPALRATGWEIITHADFPYRIATAGDWFADLETHRPQSENKLQKANQPQRPNQPRDWFDLRLGIVVDGQPVNLLPALVRYLRGGLEQPELEQAAGPLDRSPRVVGEHLLIPMEDGRYLPVSIARLQRIADTLVELCDQDGLNERHALTLPVAQAGRLAQLALESDAPALRSDDPALLALVDAVKDFSGIVPLPAPAHFPATLRPYQEEGLGWLQFLRRHGLGGILADDMGLGKTVQTLAHLALEKAQGRLRKPSLIVAPVSVLGNWRQEIRRFTPELTLLVLHGAKRKELFDRIDSVDIVIVGYPVLLLDGEFLMAREFCFVILDEAQTIKNPRAKVSQVARALRAEHRLCLTGTPMENHLGELWSLVDFAQPGLLGGQMEFQRRFRTPIENDGDSKRARVLSRRIEPFLIRRTKDAVAQDLPPKVQIVEPIELDERQRDFYDGIRLSMHRRVREAIENQGLARSRITVLDALLKLRQACCDPRLVAPDSMADPLPSAKLDWLSTMLPELIAEGRRILLFSQFTSMLRLIETLVTDLSIPYCLLTGETQQRAALIERFQGGTVPLFLISLRAGGTGLNLTAADTIIHYDPWWNPAAESQATDRAHRIGQDKPVFVHKLIAQGTVEEKIMQLQADKQALVNQLYTERSSSPASLSVADLEALFAP